MGLRLKMPDISDNPQKELYEEAQEQANKAVANSNNPYVTQVSAHLVLSNGRVEKALTDFNKTSAEQSKVAHELSNAQLKSAKTLEELSAAQLESAKSLEKLANAQLDSAKAQTMLSVIAIVIALVALFVAIIK